MSRPSSYRSDIDGLRAIAVLSVLGFHAFPKIVRGGFVGVDVFFVISGYLISSILLKELSEGRLSLRDFYARRIKRIFPALAVVLVTSFGLGWFFLMPSELKALSKHIVAGVGFVSNFVLWSESGYFDVEAEQKPLLHLWSLGIEEQFYIAWPLLLYATWRLRIDSVWVTLGLLVSSFALNVCTLGSDAVATFFSPLTRAWELLVGGLLAHRKLSGQEQALWARPRVASTISCVGLACILAAVAGLSRYRAFPGWWAGVPVIGAALLVAAGPKALVNRWLLSNQILVGVGLISYPLYLWHWPLLSGLALIHGEVPPSYLRVLALGGSALLAYATYRFVERPFRFSPTVRLPVPKLLGAMAVATSLAAAGLFTGGMGFRFEGRPALEPLASYDYDFRKDAGVAERCWLSANDAANGFGDACVEPEDSGRPLVVVWGDSHAARFLPGLRSVYGERFRFAQFSRDSCPPVLGYGEGPCAEGNVLVAERLAHLRPQQVVLFGLWNKYLPGAREPLLETLGKLRQAGLRSIVVLGPAPRWSSDLPKLLFRRALQHDDAFAVRTFVGVLRAPWQAEGILRDALASQSSVRYVSLLDILCNAEGCLTTIDGRAEGLTTWDYGHLTTPAARYVAQNIDL